MTRASSSGKKHPPTFHHYPPDRAKKLKKAWVQKTKIKSKWKKEKQKAGLLPSQPPSPAEAGENVEEEMDSDSRTDRKPMTEQPPVQPPVQTQHSNIDGPSLRQLAKSAYSSSSLHTYKSKHGGSGRAKGQTDRGGAKGQPDMKLRMNALLAKIKRDYA